MAVHGVKWRVLAIHLGMPIAAASQPGGVDPVNELTILGAPSIEVGLGAAVRSQRCLLEIVHFSYACWDVSF